MGAILIMVMFLAAPLVNATSACAAVLEQEEECDDLSGCLPDGLILEGCWSCETDIDVWDSIRTWRIKGEVTCASGDNEISFEFDLEMSWENITSGSCID